MWYTTSSSSTYITGNTYIRYYTSSGGSVTTSNLLIYTDDIRVFTNCTILPPSEKEIKRIQLKRLEIQKLQRKVIKRSIKFLTQLIGEEAFADFLHDGKIRVTGEKAIFEIIKGYSAISHPNVKIYCRWSGLLLCSLCIHTKGNTPALDHIATLIMHIQAQEEDELLRIGNCFAVTEDGRNTAWLQKFLSFSDRNRFSRAENEYDLAVNS